MKPIPHPPRLPGLGNVHQILMAGNPIEGIGGLLASQGPIFELQMPLETFVVVASRELVAEVCDEARFEKVVPAPLRQMRPLGGDGLITVDNEAEVWGQAHRILRPAFTREAMKRYVAMMVEVADAMVQSWAALPEHAVVDAADQVGRLTLDTIALCGFGARFESFARPELHPFIPAINRAMTELSGRARRLGPLKALSALRQAALDRDLALMNALVDGLIQERRAHPERFEDDQSLVTLMVATTDPVTGQGLSDENIRHQSLTFLLAGHETTSSLLTHSLWALSEHPAIQARVIEEVDAALGPPDGPPPDYARIMKLRYTRQVLEESMRLCPPVGGFARRAKEDVVLGGEYALPAGRICMVYVNGLHRDPAAWGEDVDTFDPERFSPSRRPPEHAFKPFGTGPRACIGRQFALFEATMALARVFQRFELTPAPGSELKLSYPMTTSPSGVKLRLRQRT
ncbi:MAG: cytochrome P450 [Alphaproteobacteria bacterium]|nr:cytochrome P450 [Alphaproteobacteria bacterium]MCB9793216.1 cytochrome P450 [Alphaproteobacteria bacterium]